MDHPHAYGDKPSSNRSVVREKGSSPRVWGQETHMTEYVFPIGIIPTRMGTRISHSKSAAMSGDHPHAYGDKTMSLTGTKTLSGSSPRVWGQALASGAGRVYPLIIPTRMGTSRKYAKNHKQQKDHPHAYGDKEQTERYISFQAGSSPRVWGQGVIADIEFSPPGIIPTRMGTSKYPIILFRSHWDHPHAYGDKAL